MAERDRNSAAWKPMTWHCRGASYLNRAAHAGKLCGAKVKIEPQKNSKCRIQNSK